MTARDIHGNTATAFTGIVTIAIGANPGGSVLGGTATGAAVAGVATFSGLSLNKTGTGYTLTANTPSALGATSAAFNITPGPATQLAFTVQPVTTVAGTAITPAVQVTARDAQGNTATSFSGAIACTLDRDASTGAQGVSDMSFTASGALCVNERTLYAPIDNGQRFRRAIVLGEARALDVLTIDPASGEFRRERYPLDEAAFESANAAVAASSGLD